MPKKTLYVKDEDMEIWDKAEALGTESLSSIVTTALRRYVLSKENGGPYDWIELKVAVFNEDNQAEGSKPVRFQGRLLAREGGCFVYETARKRVAFYSPVDEWFYCLDDYDTLDDAAKATKKANGKKVSKFSSSLLSDVAKELHGSDWVEELDI